MPRLCASIALACILEVELFDYVVDGGYLRGPGWGEGGSQMGDMASRWGKSNPQDAMFNSSQNF